MHRRQGLPLLGRVAVVESLEDATADCHLIVGTTARTGGWRRALESPEQAAGEIAAALARGERAALVFGSEDRGLENAQIERCQRIVTIPTSGEASSLNLAQAVLLLLYECAKAARRLAAEQRGRPAADAEGEASPGITGAESERLMASLRDALLRLDAIHGDNPDYFLMPWRRLFARARLRRHEYDAFMGLCRQIRNRVPPKG